METESILTAAFVLIHGLAIVTLLLAEGRQPTATLAWLFAIIFLPGVGLGAHRLLRLTSAAMDRLLHHHAHVIEMDGDSFRNPPHSRGERSAS